MCGVHVVGNEVKWSTFYALPCTYGKCNILLTKTKIFVCAFMLGILCSIGNTVTIISHKGIKKLLFYNNV